MDPEQREQWRRADEVFAALAELAPGERPAALAALGLPPALEARVARLLAADARAVGPLDGAPPLDLLAGAPETAPADLAGRRLGAYRLREEIGRGGMAVVYAAERADGAFDQEVAVKVLGTGLLPAAGAERFRTEQQVLARLRHRSIAAMLDGGVAEDGTPFLVMERIEGRPIDRYCEEEGLGLRERLALFVEVCGAVAFAHQNLVVHRDVKPSNVLVSRRGEVKLLDFGIAKLLEPEPPEAATRTYARVLTPGYAAPEQVAGGPVTTATDVFGLGKLLDRLLAGLPRDRDLDNVLARALREEPERRYPDARSFADDLERWLAGRPVAATPDTLLYRLGKAVRRHRAGVAAGGLVAAVGAAGLAVSLAQAERARREAANAAAIGGFLADLFRASDPDAAQGEDPRASELFARGAARAREQYRADPLLQADLLFEIGRIQGARGQYEGAAAALEDVIRLRAARLGDGDPAVARARVELGGVRYNQGDVAAAIALLRQALGAFERSLPADHLDRLGAELRLADMLVVAGEHLEARERSERALARIARLGARGATLEPAGRQTLGIALHELGELERAAAELRRAVDLERRRSPGGSLDLARFLSDYGLVLHDQRDLAGTESAYAESLELRRRLLGERHVEVLASLVNLGYVLSDQDRFEESLSRHGEALAIARAIFHEPHPDLAAAISSTAVAMRRAGRPEEALPLFEECLAVWRGIPAEAQVPTYPNDLSLYGSLLLDLGRDGEAEEVLRRAVAEFERLVPTGGVRAEVARARLAVSRLRRGRAAEAAAGLDRALPAIAPTPAGWGSRGFFGWKADHARALLGAGRRAEAGAVAAELRARFAARPDEVWPEGEALLAGLEADLARPR
jgi:serine/threonine-protein kinase